MKKTYSVDYMYTNDIGTIHSNRIHYTKEEDARALIDKIMNDENVAKISYIYLTTTETVI